MRKTIAALQTSLNGFIEGPNGELDETRDSVDTCTLGRVMYPGYEQYWQDVLAHPGQYDNNEVAYACWADQTPHIVLSKTLDRVAWKTTRIVRDVDDTRKLKQAPGKDMYVVGGATLVSSLMNLGLIDELRLMVNPVILGGGKSLFKDVKERYVLKLIRVQPLKSGKVSLTYSSRT
jgi:dihydrofolate reductase